MGKNKNKSKGKPEAATPEKIETQQEEIKEEVKEEIDKTISKESEQVVEEEESPVPEDEKEDNVDQAKKDAIMQELYGQISSSDDEDNSDSEKDSKTQDDDQDKSQTDKKESKDTPDKEERKKLVDQIYEEELGIEAKKDESQEDSSAQKAASVSSSIQQKLTGWYSVAKTKVIQEGLPAAQAASISLTKKIQEMNIPQNQQEFLTSAQNFSQTLTAKLDQATEASSAYLPETASQLINPTFQKKDLGNFLSSDSEPTLQTPGPEEQKEPQFSIDDDLEEESKLPLDADTLKSQKIVDAPDDEFDKIEAELEVKMQTQSPGDSKLIEEIPAAIQPIPSVCELKKGQTVEMDDYLCQGSRKQPKRGNMFKASIGGGWEDRFLTIVGGHIVVLKTVNDNQATLKMAQNISKSTLTGFWKTLSTKEIAQPEADQTTTPQARQGLVKSVTSLEMLFMIDILIGTGMNAGQFELMLHFVNPSKDMWQRPVIKRGYWMKDGPKTKHFMQQFNQMALKHSAYYKGHQIKKQ